MPACPNLPQWRGMRQASPHSSFCALNPGGYKFLTWYSHRRGPFGRKAAGSAARERIALPRQSGDRRPGTFFPIPGRGGKMLAKKQKSWYHLLNQEV